MLVVCKRSRTRRFSASSSEIETAARYRRTMLCSGDQAGSTAARKDGSEALIMDHRAEVSQRLRSGSSRGMADRDDRHGLDARRDAEQLLDVGAQREIEQTLHERWRHLTSEKFPGRSSEPNRPRELHRGGPYPNAHPACSWPEPCQVPGTNLPEQSSHSGATLRADEPDLDQSHVAPNAVRDPRELVAERLRHRLRLLRPERLRELRERLARLRELPLRGS